MLANSPHRALMIIPAHDPLNLIGIWTKCSQVSMPCAPLAKCGGIHYILGHSALLVGIRIIRSIGTQGYYETNNNIHRAIN